jgi:hypothetical protein
MLIIKLLTSVQVDADIHHIALLILQPFLGVCLLLVVLRSLGCVDGISLAICSFSVY